MKKITKEELPEILTEDVINTLVGMAMEFPKSTFDWAEISEILEKRGQLTKILDIVQEKQKLIEKTKNNIKNGEQKRFEEDHKRNFYENIDPSAFYGNMGEPETPQEYKNKYGVWPPGYDENGNKM